MSFRNGAGSMAMLGLVLAAPLPGISNAAGFPEKPMRLIVPFPPGGAADRSARNVTQRLAEELRQPIVVENRGGAGTLIGTTAFLKASADGYTWFLHTPPTAINPTLLRKLPYDTTRDIIPVVTLAKVPLIVLVPATVAATSVRELVALSKSKPDGLMYASSGNGGSPHLATEMLRKVTGMKLTHVPYQGSAPAVGAVLGGHVDFTITSTFTRQQIEAGRVRAVAVTGAKRWFLLPDTPTVAEQGFADYEASTWQGISVPRGTSRNLIELINREVVKVLRSPEVAKRFANEGFEIIADTPQQAAQFLRSEIAKWGEAVRLSGAAVN